MSIASELKHIFLLLKLVEMESEAPKKEAMLWSNVSVIQEFTENITIPLEQVLQVLHKHIISTVLFTDI